MNISSFDNKIQGSYQNKELSNSQKQKVVDNGSATDQVLDLSGSKESITNEILKQDLKSIKAVKIEGKLVSLNSEQLSSLIGELKDKCLDENNLLKENFKFVNFEKTTGISVVESKLDISQIKDLFNIEVKLSENIENINKNIKSFDLTGEWTKNGKSLSELHEKKSQDINSMLSNIVSLEKDLKVNIDNLSLLDPNNPKINELNSQLDVLKSSKDFLSSLKDYHHLASTDGCKNPSESFLSNMALIRDNIFESKTNLENSLKYNAPSISNEEFKSTFSKVLNKTSEQINLVSDAIELCSNSSFNRLQNIMEKPRQFSSVIEQYKVYKGLFDDGREVRGRKGETNDVKGFMLARNNDLRSDIKIAEKIQNVSNKIMKGEYTDREQLRKEVDGMFRKSNGAYFVSKEAANAVVDRCLKLYDLKTSKASLEKLNAQVKDINNELEEHVISKIQSSDEELTDFNKYPLGSYKDFGVNAEKSLGDIDLKTKKELESLEKEIKSYQRNVQDRIIYDYSDMSSNSNDLIKFLKNNLNYDSKVSIRVGVKVGAEASITEYGSAGVNANAKIALTVEKRYTQGNSYRVSLDFSAGLGIEAKLTEYLTLNAGISLDASLGIGFEKISDIENFANKLTEFMTEGAKESPDVRLLQRLGGELSEILNNSYDAILGAQAEAEYSAEIPLSDIKSDGDYFSRESTEYKNGKTIVNSYIKKSGDDAKYTEDGEEKEISIDVFQSTSSLVKSTLERSTVIAPSLENPYPVLDRKKMVVDIDFKDFNSYLSGEKNVPDEMIKSLASALISSEPDLLFVGQKDLEMHLDDFFKNAKNSAAYARVEPIVVAYKEYSDQIDEMKKYLSLKPEKLPLVTKAFPQGDIDAVNDVLDLIQNKSDINLVVDIIDNKDSGKRELKLSIQAKGSLDIDLLKREAKSGDDDVISGKAYLKAGVGMEFNVNSVVKSISLGDIHSRTSR